MPSRQPPRIPPPASITPDEPDSDTRKGLKDYTSPSGAEGRIFYMNLKFFHYGTNDKAHAAAIFLSMALLVAVLIVLAISSFSKNSAAAERTVTSLLSVFTVTVGIAVGKGVSSRKD